MEPNQVGCAHCYDRAYRANTEMLTDPELVNRVAYWCAWVN